jgi:hypothetical protein
MGPAGRQNIDGKMGGAGLGGSRMTVQAAAAAAAAPRGGRTMEAAAAAR